MEINGLSVSQAATATNWINGLDVRGVSALLMEHTPVAGNPEIPQNVFRINVAGPDISAFVQRVRDKVLDKTGNPLDLDENRTGDLEAIRQAWQTHGGAIENRSALKAALHDIWRNGARCMSGADAQILSRWMLKKGFKNRQELKAWLNLTPPV